jgi:hypothetical protein
MLVNDLSYMEHIVSQRHDLEWQGWDIVKYTKSNSAMFNQDGIFKNGSWYKKKVFPVTEIGWTIPNSIGRLDADLER